MDNILTTVLNSITAHNVGIREWLNVCLIPLNISMMVIIGYTVWRQTRFSYGWTKYPGANSACALWWVFFADFLRAGMAWEILRGGVVPGSITVAVYMIAAMIAMAATLRCIWCLTPMKGRNFTWIGALTFMVVFVMVVWITGSGA